MMIYGTDPTVKTVYMVINRTDPNVEAIYMMIYGGPTRMWKQSI